MAIFRTINRNGEILTPKYGSGCFFADNAAVVGEIFFQRRDFLVADEIVQRDVEPHVMRVAIVDGLFQLLVGEIEIAFVHAHVEMLAAEIDRVRARLHIRDQRVPRPSRSQELDRFPRHMSAISPVVKPSDPEFCAHQRTILYILF